MTGEWLAPNRDRSTASSLGTFETEVRKRHNLRGDSDRNSPATKLTHANQEVELTETMPAIPLRLKQIQTDLSGQELAAAVACVMLPAKA